jgi:hypothetical protein
MFFHEAWELLFFCFFTAHPALPALVQSFPASIPA